MSHLSGQGLVIASGGITDDSDVGGPTVKDSLDTLEAEKAPLASPALTGTPTVPTAAPGTSTTQAASTAFVTIADNLKANLASPTFTGTPAAPTAAPGTNTTQLATCAFVAALGALKVDAAFTPGDAGDWEAPAPTTIQQAIDRLAAAVAVLNAAPIP